MVKGVGRKISRGGSNEKNTKRPKNSTVEPLPGVGGQRKKDRKIAKKRPKNSANKTLSTISVPCMKIQGGPRPHCPPLPTPMGTVVFIVSKKELYRRQKRRAVYKSMFTRNTVMNKFWVCLVRIFDEISLQNLLFS